MRLYGTLQTRFWTHSDIRNLSDTPKLLAVYLLTSTHTNMLGCFRIPTGYMAEDLHWTEDKVRQGLADLSKINFLSHDKVNSWIMIHNFLKFHPIKNPNQGKAIANLYDEIPKDLCFISVLTQKILQQSKYLKDEFRNSLETMSQQFLNQEQYQEQYQYQKQDLTSLREVVDSVDEKITPQLKKLHCPHEEIIKLYHDTLPMCPPVRSWNKKRQAFLRQRWSENEKHQMLDWWKNFFDYVKESKFLIGKVNSRNDQPPFLTNLEWLVRPNNFVKVIEGYYHRESV